MRSALLAGLVYFAIVFAAGFLMGLVRVPFLVPRLGERTAEIIEMPFMFVAIIFAARWLIKRFAFSGEALRPMTAGLVASVLLLLVEFGVVLRLRGLSLDEYLSGRDPVAAAVYYAMIGFFAVAPGVVARMKKAPHKSGATWSRINKPEI